MPSREIGEIRKLADKDLLSKSEVSHLMSTIRIELERQALKQKYDVLFMYCNWAAHPEIDREERGYQILEDLTDIILFYAGMRTIAPPSYDPGLFTDINSACIAKLRDQIIDFLFQNLLPTHLFVALYKWSRFFGTLAEILEERPLKFPKTRPLKGKSKKYYDSIKSKVGKSHLAVVGFYYYHVSEKERPGYGGLNWNIETELVDGSGVLTWRGRVLSL